MTILGLEVENREFVNWSLIFFNDLFVYNVLHLKYFFLNLAFSVFVAAFLFVSPLHFVISNNHRRGLVGFVSHLSDSSVDCSVISLLATTRKQTWLASIMSCDKRGHAIQKRGRRFNEMKAWKERQH